MYKPFIATVLLAIPLSTAVRAEVILNADSEFGAQSVTVDVTNGLEYLDLTMTTNISYTDMISTHLAAGGIYEGWRYANIADLNALISSAGISFDSSFELSPVDIVMNLSNSLGQTFSFPDGDLASGVYDNGSGVLGIFEFGPAFDIEELVQIGYYNLMSFEGDNPGDSAGHWIVRAVPAPGSTAILAMTGLLATRRRR